MACRSINLSLAGEGNQLKPVIRWLCVTLPQRLIFGSDRADLPKEYSFPVAARHNGCLTQRLGNDKGI